MNHIFIIQPRRKVIVATSPPIDSKPLADTDGDGGEDAQDHDDDDEFDQGEAACG